MLSRALTMDRIAGQIVLAQLWVNNGQDCRITRFTGQIVLAQLWVDNGQDGRITGFTRFTGQDDGLNWGLTMDRITGLQDLQDKGFNKTNSGA